MTRAPRPVPVILDELAAVERYLADAPPHSGSGHRDDLQRRIATLRRELADARSPAQPSPVRSYDQPSPVRSSAQPSSEPSTDTNDSISPG